MAAPQSQIPTLHLVIGGLLFTGIYFGAQALLKPEGMLANAGIGALAGAVSFGLIAVINSGKNKDKSDDGDA